MALPTLDAVFASAADVPRRYMLAQWLVGEKEEVAGSSSVLVSGAGSEEVNGTYTERGELNGKPYYNLVGEPDNTNIKCIVWDGDQWRVVPEDVFYFSISDTAFPWQAVNWQNGEGESPVPTVIEIPAFNPIANYTTLPERYLWAKIAVAAGGPKDEAAYIGLPKQYAWKDIYDAVSGSSLGTIDWTEKQALGHIAAAYRGDTSNPENLATYINWPWRYQVASIITHLATPPEPTTFNAVIVSGAGSEEVNGTYTLDGEVGGKGFWRLNETNIILWDEAWRIDGSDANLYASEEDVEFPWQVTEWTTYNGLEPAPTLTLTNV